MNNIFEFSTKELTLDAFLCWVSNFKDEKGNVGQVSINLIKFLENKTGKEIDEKIISIKQHRQALKSKIDVVLEVEFENKEKKYYIFENKTWTSNHSDQLEEHIESFEKAYGKEKCEYFYFKIGDWNDKDFNINSNLKKDYTFINRVNIIEFLEENIVESDIYTMYLEYLKNIEKGYQDKVGLVKQERMLEEDEYEKIFNNHSGHYLILNEIKNKFLHQRGIAHGNSIGGDPWSNYPLVWHEKSENSWYGIFWRIDKKVNKNFGRQPYLSLRVYKEDGVLKDIDNFYFNGMREIFKELSESKKYGDLTFKNPGNRGTKEREIGILYFNENTIPTVIKEIPKFTKEFAEKVNLKSLFVEKIHL